MKFLHRFSASIIERGIPRPSNVRVLSYHRERRPNMYQELSIRYRERISVIPFLDEWVARFGAIPPQKLEWLISTFRERHRYTAALQMREWKSRNNRIYAILPAFVADQLDLVYIVHGIDQAEKFFNELEDYLVDYPVYVALLNCYTKEKFIPQAEATMNHIRKFNSRSALPYSMMLSLYCKCHQHEKLDALVREMQEKGVPHNKCTYPDLFKGYACSNPEKMENALKEMESDGRFPVEFRDYAKVARGYINAGALEKAFELLKKSESLLEGKRSSYVMLIAYYADMQKREDVYRILDLFLKLPGLTKRDYDTMISSLVKLDDLEGANKIAEQWEGTDPALGIWFPNLVIGGYCKKGDVRKAEAIVKRLVDSGKELDARTFGYMAVGYVRDGEMEKAVEVKKKALRAGFPNSWRPCPVAAEACLEYLQRKGDMDGMHEFLMLLEKHSSLTSPRMKRNVRNMKEIIERFSGKGKPKPKTGLDVNFFYVPKFTSTNCKVAACNVAVARKG